MRTVAHLNFDWKYTPSFQPAMLVPAYDDRHFLPAHLPHTNRELPFSCFDETASQFVSCYRKHFHVPGTAWNQRVLLHFEGVMTAADVHVNGRLAGSHLGGYTPFRLDITDLVRFGEDNLLAVRVDSTERPDIPPFGKVVDYLPYGGIYREVRLECVDLLSLGNVRIRTRRVFDGEWQADVDLFWENAAGVPVPVRLSLSLEFEGKSVAVLDKVLTVSAEPFSQSTQVLSVRDVRLWDVEAPNLYTLRIRVGTAHGSADGSDRLLPDLLEDLAQRMGFREAEFRPDGFFLNGRHLPLRGLNRHQSFPHVGNAMPRSAQQRDADILKRELGCNLVRSSHYPPSAHFLDRCDEIGLLVFEEIPGWQHIGDDAWKAVALRNVEEMIRRDRNHPSIVLWGVRINESQDDDAFYRETNRIAHQLDGTRQTGGVRNFAGSRLFEDVYTFNDFVHHGGNRALQRPGAVTRQKPVRNPKHKSSASIAPDKLNASVEATRHNRDANGMRLRGDAGASRSPSRRIPYLVTEHNGHMFPTKTTDQEAKRTEHALRHLRVLDAAGRNRRISGAIGWCMADYNTHRDFGSGDRICHHGVLDMYRLPKTAAAAYAAQQDGQPVLEVSSSMDIGEHDGGSLSVVHVFTNCEAVRLYRNGEPVGTFQPDRKAYPGLPHPPVVIRDFIGDRLERTEGLSHADAETIKRVLRAIVRYGDKSLPLRYLLAMGWQMLKNRISYARAVGFYDKYIGNWGEKSLVWRFEGIRNGKAVMTVEKGAASGGELFVLPDRTSLCESETWDACRVVVRHLDARGNRCLYSHEVVTLSAEGAGEIIGPRLLPLAGGATAFWVRTNGKAGRLGVVVRSERFGAVTVAFEVEKRTAASPS